MDIRSDAQIICCKVKLPSNALPIDIGIFTDAMFISALGNLMINFILSQTTSRSIHSLSTH